MCNKSFTDNTPPERAVRQRLFIRPLYSFDYPDEIFFQIDNEKISVRLKPCPHCGGQADYKITTNDTITGYGTENHFVQCKNCLASTMRVTVSVFSDEENIYGTIKATIKNIVENWNSRAKDIPRPYKTKKRSGMGYDYDDPICPNCGYLLCPEPVKNEMPDQFYCRDCGQLIQMR